MADGWLSTAKAHVIHRAVENLPGNPETRRAGVQALLAEAKALDATELRKVGNRLASIVDPDGQDRRDETGPRPARTSRPPRPVPDHHRRPRRRRLDPRTLLRPRTPPRSRPP